MANEYVEDPSEEEEEVYTNVDADIMYDQYCKKMFRDFKTQKIFENVEKAKAYLWKENQAAFKRVENIMKATMYDKRYQTSKEIRVERQRLKAFQGLIAQKMLRMEENQNKQNGPLVRPLVERIEMFKKRIIQNADKYKVTLNTDKRSLCKN